MSAFLNMPSIMSRMNSNLLMILLTTPAVISCIPVNTRFQSPVRNPATTSMNPCRYMRKLSIARVIALIPATNIGAMPSLNASHAGFTVFIRSVMACFASAIDVSTSLANSSSFLYAVTNAPARTARAATAIPTGAAIPAIPAPAAAADDPAPPSAPDAVPSEGMSFPIIWRALPPACVRDPTPETSFPPVIRRGAAAATSAAVLTMVSCVS